MLARTLEMNKIMKGRKSIFKQATKFVTEYNFECNFNEVGNIITAGSKTAITDKESPQAIKGILKAAVDKKTH